jgi:hypothetical protein
LVTHELRSSTRHPLKSGPPKQSQSTRSRNREPGAIFLLTDFTDNLFANSLMLAEVGRITVMLSAAGCIVLDKDGNGLCEIDDDLDGLPEHILSRLGRC